MPKRYVEPVEGDEEVEEVAELFGELGSVVYLTIYSATHPGTGGQDAVRDAWTKFGRKLARWSR